jgi:hypothetical protein
VTHCGICGKFGVVIGYTTKQELPVLVCPTCDGQPPTYNKVAA